MKQQLKVFAFYQDEAEVEESYNHWKAQGERTRGRAKEK